MKKRNRLRNCRVKALFGIDGALNAAATTAAAIMQATATRDAARTQASAIQSSTDKNVEALIKQNENNTKLQEKSIQFTREQNEINRDLQKDVQMQLQFLTGQQNTNELREAAKIQVRNGGSVRRKLSNGNEIINSSFLQGKNISGIETPHKGNYIPIGYTPNGILTMITGPNHDNGGVDVDINGHKDIEAEGGELMHIKYALGGKPYGKNISDVQFISKHKLPGTNFNPAKEVLSGIMTPDQAFNMQENIKNVKGISDDGKGMAKLGKIVNYNTPVRSMRTYGGLNIIPVNPDLSLDFLSPVATGVVAGTKNKQTKYGRSLKKCGGRRKAEWGWWEDLDDVQKGNIYGAGFNVLGNIGGALITTIGNRAASKYLTDAYTEAGDKLAEAYNNLTYYDPDKLDYDMFRAQHVKPALQAPIVNTGAQRTAAERTLQRNLSRINHGTLSSAAAQNRSARAEIDYNDRLSQIAESADKIRQGIIQGNMQRIQQADTTNAQLDTQARQSYAQGYLSLLDKKYDTINERIRGAAQAKADALIQNASTLANTKQANANTWANTISGIGSTFGNTLATNGKMTHEYNMTMLGASDDAVLRAIYSNPNTRNSRNAAYSIWLRYRNSNSDNYKKIAEDLASTYGFA